MKFDVHCKRTEVWTETTQVEAESADEAQEQVDKILATEGWDGVFNGDDGDYQECTSEVFEVEPVTSQEE